MRFLKKKPSPTKEEKLQESIKPEDIKVQKPHENLDKKFLADIIKKKKEVVSKEFLTKEELYEALEKYYQVKKYEDNNPFKTREDYFITFYYSDMTIARDSVPFEMIKIAGKEFLINKKFEGGTIIIEELYPFPQLEINLEEEYANKESTKKQLEKINKYLLYIKDKIAKGDDRYNLIDIEDIKEEKIRLEKILQSIKYGKTAMFNFQHPFTKKKTLMMKKRNGEYHFLKFTDDGYVVEENNIRSVKGTKIIRDVETITNRRKNINFKQILFSILIFLVSCAVCFGAYKLITFDEVLFDKRVAEAVDTRTLGYQNEIDFLRGTLKARGIAVPQTINNSGGPTTDFSTPR